MLHTLIASIDLLVILVPSESIFNCFLDTTVRFELPPVFGSQLFLTFTAFITLVCFE